MALRGDAANDALLAELSRQAFASAATRLQVDPYLLARSLGDGRIAELLLELRSVAYWAHPRDRDRIEGILDEVYAAIRGGRRVRKDPFDEGGAGRPAPAPASSAGGG